MFGSFYTLLTTPHILFIVTVFSLILYLFIFSNFQHRRHPNILLRRLFVFNYSFDDPRANSMISPLKAGVKDPDSIIIFPPDGTCGGSGGNSYDESSGEFNTANNNSNNNNAPLERGVSMVDVHLNEVMSHAALHIVLALEQQTRLCEEARVKNLLPDGLPMSTIFDEIEEQQLYGGSSNSSGGGGYTNRDSTYTPGGKLGISAAINMNLNTSSRNNKNTTATASSASVQYKRKPSGRIHKWMGDLAMQACSPRDAVEYYSAAITECRALGETLWLAGALDGYASAVLLLVHMQANLEEILGKELRSVVVNNNNNSSGGGGSGGGNNNSATNTTTNTGDVYLLTDSTIEKAYRLAEDRMNDAISIYASNIVFCALEVECILRVARMHETSPVPYNKESKVSE